MSERMSAADVTFLHRETRTAPQHVGGLVVLDVPSGGFDYERLVRLLEERISLAPRYRQKVRMVPGHLANPVWVDDPRFDITYHVRRSALPRPGTDAQLLEFCARIQSRLLDRGPAAVGDVPGRGPGPRPHGHRDEDARRDGRRARRHRPRRR